MTRPSTVVIGAKHHRLTVLGRAENRNQHTYVHCRCECGREITAKFLYVRSGHTKSCGCQRAITAEKARTFNTSHKASNTPEYHAWQSIKARCFNNRLKCYPAYGGRGISMCDEWRESFEAFIGHIGLRPTAKHSIDRIDNSGDYEPGNIRWATSQEQNWNKRTVNMLTHEGETLPLNEWARRKGMRQGTLWRRVHHLGWTVTRALTVPTNIYHKLRG